MIHIWSTSVTVLVATVAVAVAVALAVALAVEKDALHIGVNEILRSFLPLLFGPFRRADACKSATLGAPSFSSPSCFVMSPHP